MNDSPLVSVVMIFLNAEQFISEAIESVLAQTYPTWELFLVDDGSSDASTKIAERFAADNLQKVHYLDHADHQNLGMSASRNLGIRNAKGEIIAFLDSDDVWLPQKLDHQVSVLESHAHVGMVYGPALDWYSWTGRPEDVPRDHVVETHIPPGTVLMPPRLLSLYLTHQTLVPSPSHVLVRRSVVDHIGGFEESFKGMHEDQAFLSKVILAAPVMITGEVLDKYRQHEGSCYAVAKKGGRVSAATLVYFNWLSEYMSLHGFQHTEVWRDLQEAMWPYKHPFAAAVRTRWRSRVRQVRRIFRRLHGEPTRDRPID
jgi:glycosyltransferase involved in cell wall biosynthesis